MNFQGIDIFIGYEEKLVYEGLCALLSTRDAYNVIGGTLNGQEVFKRLKFKLPEVLIIELNVPNSKAVDYLQEIHEEFPIPKIMLISTNCNGGNVSKIMESGIHSFVLKGCNKEDFFNAMEHIVQGKKYYCAVVTEHLFKEYKNSHENVNSNLTTRELTILRHLIDGNTNKEIAYNLNINESTVKTHRKNIMDKMGTKNLLTLVRYACRNRLVDYGMDSCCLSCPYRQ